MNKTVFPCELKKLRNFGIENCRTCVMIMQKQILNQSKSMPAGYTFQKEHIKKTILQVLRERSRTSAKEYFFSKDVD